MKVLILGSSGLLGRTLCKCLSNNFKIFHNGIKKRKFNLKSKKNIKLLLLKNPDLIINCSGETNIELCEKNKKKSKDINVGIIKNIFELKKKLSLKFNFIQFSTDQLYDNKLEKNNLEKSNPKINNFYSYTKLLSEKVVLKNGGMVLRTNFFGKSISNKKSFSDWIYFSFKSGKKFFLLSDIYFSPLRIFTICKLLKKIIIKGVKPGMFNLGSKNGMTKHAFAVKFAKYCKVYNKNFKVKKSKELFRIKRSNYMIMNCDKFENVYKIKLPTLDSEIKKESNNYL